MTTTTTFRLLHSWAAVLSFYLVICLLVGGQIAVAAVPEEDGSGGKTPNTVLDGHNNEDFYEISNNNKNMRMIRGGGSRHHDLSLFHQSGGVVEDYDRQEESGSHDIVSPPRGLPEYYYRQKDLHDDSNDSEEEQEGREENNKKPSLLLLRRGRQLDEDDDDDDDDENCDDKDSRRHLSEEDDDDDDEECNSATPAPSATPSSEPSMMPSISNQGFCDLFTDAEPDLPDNCAALDAANVGIVRADTLSFDPATCVTPGFPGPPAITGCGSSIDLPGGNNWTPGPEDSCMPVIQSGMSLFGTFTTPSGAQYAYEIVCDFIDYGDKQFCIIPETHKTAGHWVGVPGEVPTVFNQLPKICGGQKCTVTGNEVIDITNGGSIAGTWSIQSGVDGGTSGTFQFDRFCPTTDWGRCRAVNNLDGFDPRTPFVIRNLGKIQGSFIYDGQEYDINLIGTVDEVDNRNGNDHTAYFYNTCKTIQGTDFTPNLPAGSTINCPILSEKIGVSGNGNERRLPDGSRGNPLVDGCTFTAADNTEVVFTINFR